MSNHKAYRMPLRFRLFKLRRWMYGRINYLLQRIRWRVNREVEFDPIIWAAGDAGELRMTVNPCTAEWEIHIKVKSKDGFDTFEAYTINEVDVVTSGYRMRDAIDRVCWEHCMKYKILP